MEVLNLGDFALYLHSFKELWGRIDRWPYTGRIWKWMADPANQLISYVDRNRVWIR